MLKKQIGKKAPLEEIKKKVEPIPEVKTEKYKKKAKVAPAKVIDPREVQLLLKHYPTLKRESTFNSGSANTRIVHLVDIDGVKYVVKIFLEPEVAAGKKEATNTRAIQEKTEHVAKVINSEGNESRYEILYEYGGVSLQALFYTFPFTPDILLPMMEKLASVYNIQIKLDIVNSDIKPLNILYNQDTGMVKVIDFGSSFKMTRGDKPLITHIIGSNSSNEITEYTRMYNPPEIIWQNPKAKSLIYSSLDVYCFGMTIYQLALKKTTQIIEHENDTWKNLNLSEYSIDDSEEQIDEKFEKKYNEFLKQIDEIKPLNDPKASKLRSILRACLTFNKRKRPTFNALESVLKEMIALPGTFEENQEKYFPKKPEEKKEEEKEGDSSIDFYDLTQDKKISDYDAFLIADRINSELTRNSLRSLTINGCELSSIGTELIMKAIIGIPYVHTLNMGIKKFNFLRK